MAAPLPAAAAAEVWSALEQVHADHPSVRWLPPEKLHLTLVFLGQTEPSRLVALSDAIAGVARHHAPIPVATGRAGGRVSDRRGGVAWLKLWRGHRAVSQLARDVDRAAGSNLYKAGVAPRPHLTVARGITKEALKDLDEATIGVDVRWLVSRIVLFRSHTGPGGSRYEELTSVDLAA